MITYVESNFVLESAFQQEDSKSCDELIELAEDGRIQLLIPAYCLGEPYERMIRRDRQRKEVYRRLSDELRELSRSAPYSASAAELAKLTGLLVEAGDQEMNQLNAVLARLLEVAILIPLDQDTLKSALGLQKNLGLSPQDSIVYASVRSRALVTGSEQCFINKNAKDFLIPQIEGELSAHNCRLLAKFADGLAYIRSRLPQ